MDLNPKKAISTFGLVMINVIAICSLRTLPFAAEFGWNLIIIYALATIGFLLPIAAIASFLVSKYPERGGLYVWVRKALGPRIGLLAIWLQWLYNLLWFPTAMVFVINTMLIALGLQPELATVLILTTAVFWLITLANCFGMRVSTIISVIGAALGTVLPIILLIYFATDLLQVTPMPLKQNWHNIQDLANLPLVVNILFGLMGIEMCCVHAAEVQNPKQAYPRALIISSLIIALLLAGSSLALALVVPPSELSLISGVNQAFLYLLHKNYLGWLVPSVLCCIALGGLACIGAWIIGPSKGLFVAASDGLLPQFFAKTNRFSVPQRLLIFQAVLVTALNLFYLYMPSLEQAYIMLSVAAAQLALVTYIILIITGYLLHKKAKSNFVRNLVFKIAIILGFATTMAAFILGFKAPPSLHVQNYVYDFWLIFGMLIMVMPVFFFNGKK